MAEHLITRPAAVAVQDSWSSSIATFIQGVLGSSLNWDNRYSHITDVDLRSIAVQ